MSDSENEFADVHEDGAPHVPAAMETDDDAEMKEEENNEDTDSSSEEEEEEDEDDDFLTDGEDEPVPATKPPAAQKPPAAVIKPAVKPSVVTTTKTAPPTKPSVTKKAVVQHDAVVRTTQEVGNPTVQSPSAEVLRCIESLGQTGREFLADRKAIREGKNPHPNHPLGKGLIYPNEATLIHQSVAITSLLSPTTTIPVTQTVANNAELKAEVASFIDVARDDRSFYGMFKTMFDTKFAGTQIGAILPTLCDPKNTIRVKRATGENHVSAFTGERIEGTVIELTVLVPVDPQKEAEKAAKKAERAAKKPSKKTDAESTSEDE